MALSKSAAETLNLAHSVRMFQGTITIQDFIGHARLRGIRTLAGGIYSTSRGAAQGIARFYREVERDQGQAAAGVIAEAFVGQNGGYCWKQ